MHTLKTRLLFVSFAVAILLGILPPHVAGAIPFVSITPIAGLVGLAGGAVGGGLTSLFPTDEAFAAAFSAATIFYPETSATEPLLFQCCPR